MYYARGQSVVLQGTFLLAVISKILRRRCNCWHHQNIDIFEGLIIAVLVMMIE